MPEEVKIRVLKKSFKIFKSLIFIYNKALEEQTKLTRELEERRQVAEEERKKLELERITAEEEQKRALERAQIEIEEKQKMVNDLLIYFEKAFTWLVRSIS